MSTYITYMQDLARQTAQIQAAAEAGDWDALLRHLDQRQETMGRIDGLSPAERTISDEERAAAARVLNGVIEQDLATSQQVEAASASTRTQAQENALARTTLSAYRRATRTPGRTQSARFVDRQQ